MAKKNKKQNNAAKSGFAQKLRDLRAQIHPETERSVLAISFIAISAILVLASAHNAGPAGEATFNGLTAAFGIGYYLFPTIFLIMAGVFLSGREQKDKKFGMIFFGATLFVAAGLGLIDILDHGQGGMVGEWMGSIQRPFGYTGGIIIAVAFLVIALLLTLNIPLRLQLAEEEKEEKKKSPESEEAKIIVKNAESFSAAPKVVEPEPEEKPKAEKPEKEEMEEPELKVQNPKAFFTPRKEASGKAAQPNWKNYTPPPLSLLKSTIEKPTSGDLRANANIIKRTLESFGIPVEMGEISIGPKVTRYTLKPAEGIKLARITALGQDLALALAAHPIRIEAPIPGKSLVGIEVPNKSAAIVRLGSLMAFPEFTNSGPLGFVLGRDVSGEPIIADVGKMPHLLIAGATGSGKSVAIQALIISLLYKNSPETLRLLLIDPKRVELTMYNEIPHLISPVITEGKKALGVFKWAIQEMEQRYEKLQAAGARDIKSYNKSHPEEIMPFIVIVVDELADLMATYGRDIESSIVRLAQMARATGIHLVLATQRPSVEVITGLIKANITSRMALQVASQVDSRTILDASGAEKLLGGGDMLFVSAELSKPKRIQGAYVSEEELHKVTDFIREHNDIALSSPMPEEDKDKNPTLAAKFEGKGGNRDINFDDYAGDEDGDDMYDEAVAVVREAQKASASLLQRRLAVGYARAARLLDLMESKGVVGPGEGAKPRQVFIEKDPEM
ncbi:MAG: DNA translocase FtsK [Patescibacteria group bacterium]|nr:DNA translocase FtsK [Patescibacteria group bacterium]